MTVNSPTPAALDTGAKVRRDLTDDERAAILCAARRHRGDELIEIADALGLCGPRPLGSGLMPKTTGLLSPDFGSGKLGPR